jgi:hypothetical protein
MLRDNTNFTIPGSLLSIEFNRKSNNELLENFPIALVMDSLVNRSRVKLLAEPFFVPKFK